MPQAECANCGSRLTEKARFCPECGARVGASAQETAVWRSR
ncbi:MAG: zinc-ribbon domain-containing protein [Actinobacteria bacterium]|nr:MAG: zinc-ribbon domain-containing protein [Actinomycetota bacterium]